jgi:hypothetical protein
MAYAFWLILATFTLRFYARFACLREHRLESDGQRALNYGASSTAFMEIFRHKGLGNGWWD